MFPAFFFWTELSRVASIFSLASCQPQRCRCEEGKRKSKGPTTEKRRNDISSKNIKKKKERRNNENKNTTERKENTHTHTQTPRKEKKNGGHLITRASFLRQNTTRGQEENAIIANKRTWWNNKTSRSKDGGGRKETNARLPLERRGQAAIIAAGRPSIRPKTTAKTSHSNCFFKKKNLKKG